ncbi:very short patch repair endonuclease [Pseudomonas anuradhapurensis]|uniref:very short patch repair endonuclease n=1 Tax=Pseudomonas anuradhapurensis TaxID=485870 RepID=UPI001648CDA1|nr:very short patch repair endonuclease [Pseudomonas anuradhapurensis]QXI48239.1 very short patch repair endonuclease [Pseudomonas anuradhapurensis]
MDRLTTEHRSWLMSRVKSKDTQPEMIVRRLLFSLGYRYRLHIKDLPGSPDIVLRSRRKIIFIHGCFWHGHNCKYGRPPKTKLEFWKDKIEKNRIRDSQNLKKLDELDWKCLDIWQCETRNLQTLSEIVKNFLSPQ